LDSLNSFHPDTNLKYELEENNSIAFLDVLITRKDDGSFKNTVYRKPTHTDKYLNFNSYHHMSQKVSVIPWLFELSLFVILSIFKKNLSILRKIKFLTIPTGSLHIGEATYGI